jgi:four helix bundle protein
MGFNDEFRERTKKFAIRIINLYRNLPKDDTAKILGKQLLRAGTSAAANYRAATRARSKKEFISKIGIVVEEADETVFWIELLIESGIMPEKKLASLYKEVVEITKIMAVSRKSSKSNS